MSKLSLINDLKSLAQQLNAALDLSVRNFPVQPPQTQNFSKEKIISYTSAMKSIISGKSDELCDSVDNELNKRIEEVKKSNSSLKGKQSKLASSLLKIERDTNENKYQDPTESDKSVLLKKIEAKLSAIDNINAEILQLEAENEALQDTPIPTVKPPTTAEKKARISLKQKQQEFANLNNEYDKMKREFSIQIQQSSQGLEKSKKEVEVLEMQINSIQSRINLMNRAGNISNQKRSLQETSTSKINKLPSFNRSNGSNLPTLSLTTQCNVIEPHDVNETTDNYIPKKPSSEPQQSLRDLSFNRSNRPNRISSISDSESSQKVSRSPRQRVPTAEMDKTDKCLQEMSAAFLEAEQFLRELNAFDDDTSASKSYQSKEGTSTNNDSIEEIDLNTSLIDESIEKVNTENFNEEVKKGEVKNKQKLVSEPKSSPSTPSHRRIPALPKTPNSSGNPRNQKKKDDISFMPISEEEMKKVARPLTCNESEKPGKRIPVNLRDGYELVFFHIAERVPKLV